MASHVLDTAFANFTHSHDSENTTSSPPAPSGAIKLSQVGLVFSLLVQISRPVIKANNWLIVCTHSPCLWPHPHTPRQPRVSCTLSGTHLVFNLPLKPGDRHTSNANKLAHTNPVLTLLPYLKRPETPLRLPPSLPQHPYYQHANAHTNKRTRHTRTHYPTLVTKSSQSSRLPPSGTHTPTATRNDSLHLPYSLLVPSP